MTNEKRKSGFEDDDRGPSSQCTHIEHNPPMMLYIPHGKQYRHICPGCGREQVMRSNAATYSLGEFQ